MEVSKMNYRIVYTSCVRGVEPGRSGFQIYNQTRNLPSNSSLLLGNLKYDCPSLEGTNISAFPKDYSFKKVEGYYRYSFITYVGEDIATKRSGNFVCDVILLEDLDFLPLYSLAFDKLYLDNKEMLLMAKSQKPINYFNDETMDALSAETNYEINFKKAKDYLLANLSTKEFINSFSLVLKGILTGEKVALCFKQSETLLYLYFLGLAFVNNADKLSLTTYRENEKEDYLISGYYDLKNSNCPNYYVQATNETSLTIPPRLATFLTLLYDFLATANYLDYKNLIAKVKETDLFSDATPGILYLLESQPQIKDITTLANVLMLIKEEKITSFYQSFKLANSILINETSLKEVIKLLREQKLSESDLASILIRLYKNSNFDNIKILKNIDIEPKFYYNFILNDKQIYADYDVCLSLWSDFLPSCYDKNILLDNASFLDFIKTNWNEEIATMLAKNLPVVLLAKLELLIARFPEELRLDSNVTLAELVAFAKSIKQGEYIVKLITTYLPNLVSQEEILFIRENRESLLRDTLLTETDKLCLNNLFCEILIKHKESLTSQDDLNLALKIISQNITDLASYEKAKNDFLFFYNKLSKTNPDKASYLLKIIFKYDFSEFKTIAKLNDFKLDTNMTLEILELIIKSSNQEVTTSQLEELAQAGLISHEFIVSFTRLLLEQGNKALNALVKDKAPSLFETKKTATEINDDLKIYFNLKKRKLIDDKKSQALDYLVNIDLSLLSLTQLALFKDNNVAESNQVLNNKLTFFYNLLSYLAKRGNPYRKIKEFKPLAIDFINYVIEKNLKLFSSFFNQSYLKEAFSLADYKSGNGVVEKNYAKEIAKVSNGEIVSFLVNSVNKNENKTINYIYLTLLEVFARSNKGANMVDTMAALTPVLLSYLGQNTTYRDSLIKALIKQGANTNKLKRIAVYLVLILVVGDYRELRDMKIFSNVDGETLDEYLIYYLKLTLLGGSELNEA